MGREISCYNMGDSAEPNSRSSADRSLYTFRLTLGRLQERSSLMVGPFRFSAAAHPNDKNILSICKCNVRSVSALFLLRLRVYRSVSSGSPGSTPHSPPYRGRRMHAPPKLQLRRTYACGHSHCSLPSHCRFAADHRRRLVPLPKYQGYPEIALQPMVSERSARV